MSVDDGNEDAREAEKRERPDDDAINAEEPPSKAAKNNNGESNAAAQAHIGSSPETKVGIDESAAPTVDADHIKRENTEESEVAPKEDDKKEISEIVPKENMNESPAIGSDEAAEALSAILPGGLPPGLPTSGGQPVPVVAAPSPESVLEEKGEVSAVYVGRVIGKGGEMIRDLQARSACRIDVDQNVPPGQPRLITYRGTRKTIDFAKQLVRMLCQENINEADLPLGEAKREFLVVPASSVGKIIGRGGEMIRELQSRSQAKIQVDHRGVSGLDASEKQVTMTGTEQAVVKAKEMVLFLVANPMMDAMQSLSMLVDDKIQRGGVWGSGPPYLNLPNNGQNMQPGGGGHGNDQPYGGAGGHYGNQGPYGGGPQSYQQPPSSYGGGGGGGGGGMESEVFFAAKHFMGRIIGSKGVTINDLQKRSGCDIQINQDVPPGRDCEISLRGSRQGVDMAKNMLREIIETGPNHPYAGGGGGGGVGGGGGGNSFGGYQHGGNQQHQPYGYQQQGGYQQQQQYGQGGYNQNPGYGGAPQAQPYQQGQFQSGSSQGVYGAPPPVTPPVLEWKVAAAPDGQQYYYNERSGETTWQKPPGMP